MGGQEKRTRDMGDRAGSVTVGMMCRGWRLGGGDVGGGWGEVESGGGGLEINVRKFKF